MKLISWNVNGLRSIFNKDLEGFIIREQPDILCLQETKAWPDQLTAEQLNPLGYTGFFSLASKKGYAGVATYVKNAELVRNFRTALDLPRFDSEGRFLVTELENFTLYNIYFPSGTTGDLRQSFKYDFLDAFFEHLLSLSQPELQRVILCGDFNICHQDIDIHHPAKATKLELSGFLPRERAWLDKLEKLGFIDSFRKIHGPVKQRYSWWTFRAGARKKNLGWRIDYFWLHNSLQNRLKAADILESVGGSDHAPISISLANYL